MPRGRETLEHVRQDIIETRRQNPELPYGEIAQLVGGGIDKSTVGKILQKAGLGEEWRRKERRQGHIPQGGLLILLDRHWQQLLAPLLGLKEVQPFPLHDPDLIRWHLRPDPSWPIARGRVHREPGGRQWAQLHDADGSDIEKTDAWPALKEHLAGNPLWDSIEVCKAAVAEDVSARLALLGAAIGAAERETELPVARVPNLDFGVTHEPVLGPYYAFTIFDQVHSRALELQHRSVDRGQFSADPYRPGIVALGGTPVVYSPSTEQRELAIAVLLRLQDELVALPEARAAAEAYRHAEEAVREVRRHVERARLLPGTPPGSRCELCRPWLTQAGTQATPGGGEALAQ
ncbi:MAG: hypothetical protein HY688_00740 [Chloroflexi bacterium]|nr:hypothetical protein [Chloroflexota bacterium]